MSALDDLVNLDNWVIEYFRNNYAEHYVCIDDFPQPEEASKELAALRARIAELENPWQSIETAPKDATIINLLAKHPYIGYYARGYGFLVYLRGEWTKKTVGDEPITHWMPLPKPPEEK